MKRIFIGLLIVIIGSFMGCGLQSKDNISNKVEADGKPEFDIGEEQQIDQFIKAYVVTDKRNGQQYIVVNNNGRGLAITPRRE